LNTTEFISAFFLCALCERCGESWLCPEIGPRASERSPCSEPPESGNPQVWLKPTLATGLEFNDSPKHVNSINTD